MKNVENVVFNVMFQSECQNSFLPLPFLSLKLLNWEALLSLFVQFSYFCLTNAFSVLNINCTRGSMRGMRQCIANCDAVRQSDVFVMNAVRTLILIENHMGSFNSNTTVFDFGVCSHLF